MAAPVPQSSGTATTAFTLSGTSVTLTEAAGAAAGDTYLIYAVCSAGNTLSVSGWSTSGLQPNLTVGGANVLVIGLANRGSSAPSLVVSCSATDYIEACLFPVRGADTAGPFLGFAAANNSGGTNPDAPVSGTVTADDYLSITGALNWDTGIDGAGGDPKPAGYSNTIHIAQGSEDLAMASKALTAATSENPGAFSRGIGASTACWAFVVLIKPAGTTPSTLASTGVGAATFAGAALASSALSSVGLAIATFLAVVIAPDLLFGRRKRRSR